MIHFQGLSRELQRVFDSRYTMATNKFVNGHYSFDGYTNTKIYFDNTTRLWRMELLSDKNIRGTTDLLNDYPFGSRTWDVVMPDFEGQLELNLNSCDDFDRFGCNDGACISIKQRYTISQL